MPDVAASGAPSAEAAEAALAYLTEMSPGLRGAAIVDGDGAVLAASGDPDRWREEAAALFELAARPGGEPVARAHVGTGQGEVFALRHAGLGAVVVTEPSALAPLTFFDMRTALCDLAGGEAPPGEPRGGGAVDLSPEGELLAAAGRLIGLAAP